MPRLRRILKRLGLSLATLMLLFLVVEGATRALEPGPFSFLDSNPYMEHPTHPGVFLHRPNFQGRWDGTWYETNSSGMRGPELDLTLGEHEFRVIALGDSCTFGKGVLEEHSWPRQLEHLLTWELGSPWRPVVANLGVNGHSGATYELMFRERGLHLQPNLVLVGYNINDFPNVLSSIDEHVFKQATARRLIPQGLRDRLGRFASYRWARQTYYHTRRAADWAEGEAFARQAGEDSADTEAWLQQEQYLREIRNQAHKVGAHMAVFLFPYESQVYLDTFDASPIERLRETCRQLGVPFVDLAEEFRSHARTTTPPRELFLRGDRYHPNPEGYFLVAKRVLEVLKEMDWLPHVEPQSDPQNADDQR